jgi:hypothetical protein
LKNSGRERKEKGSNNKHRVVEEEQPHLILKCWLADISYKNCVWYNCMRERCSCSLFSYVMILHAGSEGCGDVV